MLRVNAADHVRLDKDKLTEDLFANDQQPFAKTGSIYQKLAQGSRFTRAQVSDAWYGSLCCFAAVCVRALASDRHLADTNGNIDYERFIDWLHGIEPKDTHDMAKSGTR